MQIEQIDRDAAARVHERSCYEIVRIQGAQCRNGYGDTDPLVQDFARHRLAALSARPAVGEDVVERVLAKIHAVEKVNIMGRREVTLYFGDDDEAEENMEAFVSAAIAAMGSDMGKGGEG